ncbi:YceD family protein [Sphingomicrobium sediminis]|uniref:DUF177 domain-containing protein n=1 Tax=Sphingomicrobium sediminis TaxID=2950949 RepID=A0A9X2EJT9_9SPHN|nr:YceD family protein [Sphingomicrobium sediminis]MCM8558136.1 DUF177 domain-containing protein [Sphingomicrobium sediminis]
MTDPLAPLPLATLTSGSHRLKADAALRAEIAERLGLVSLDRFIVDYRIERDGDLVHVEGRMEATSEQACVATGDPVLETLDEKFAFDFRPVPATGSEEEEIELEADEMDTIFHDGREIAIGDALVDTLSLSLDPWPRVDDADARLRAAGVKTEEEAGAFGALAGLKKRLEAGKDASGD